MGHALVSQTTKGFLDSFKPYLLSEKEKPIPELKSNYAKDMFAIVTIGKYILSSKCFCQNVDQ